ncbi:MAG: hypothetical protein R3E58_12360 [Phycisphaerae bacterium]|nr:hypothetical protein [Phycisphaerales bacterium]
MSNLARAIAFLSFLPCAAQAMGASPQLGGPMKHLQVTVINQIVSVSVDGDPNERLWLQDYGETYAGAASVLDGQSYNGQYGWLIGGIVDIPSGAGVFVELQSQSEGLLAFEQGTFAPIFGTQGSDVVWQWNGFMTHNWYAADTCGKYEAIYEVYVGDAAGNRIPEYVSDFVTLYWQFVPVENLGDIDQDGDVDLLDFAEFQTCFTGSGESTMASHCGCFDFDGDDDVDAVDYQAIEPAFEGE